MKLLDVRPVDWLILVFISAAMVVSLAARYWKLIKSFAALVGQARTMSWPTASATIDNVSVVEERYSAGEGDIVYYIATLTYFYRNPELQTGDYSRKFDFDEEDDAKAWANSYKGSTVAVHVDPRDPSRSVLRKEDL